MPGTPTNLKAVGGTGRLRFSWNRQLDGGTAITEVWVELAAVGGGWQSFVAGALTTTANIEGLASGREYRVRDSYGNDLGPGRASEEIRVLVR